MHSGRKRPGTHRVRILGVLKKEVDRRLFAHVRVVRTRGTARGTFDHVLIVQAQLLDLAGNLIHLHAELAQAGMAMGLR